MHARVSETSHSLYVEFSEIMTNIFILERNHDRAIANMIRPSCSEINRVTTVLSAAKSSLWDFLPIFLKRLGILIQTFTNLLSILLYVDKSNKI